MATETERKFLVRDNAWPADTPRRLLRQGYLSDNERCTVRVRTADDNDAWLTIKGSTQGFSREEFEYAIPCAEAKALLRLAGASVLEKWRYRVLVNGLIWEIDEFLGENTGLVLAEVELAYAAQELVLPDWIGEEVTGDPRYYNAMLVRHPYRCWK